MKKDLLHIGDMLEYKTTVLDKHSVSETHCPHHLFQHLDVKEQYIASDYYELLKSHNKTLVDKLSLCLTEKQQVFIINLLVMPRRILTPLTYWFRKEGRTTAIAVYVALEAIVEKTEEVDRVCILSSNTWISLNTIDSICNVLGCGTEIDNKGRGEYSISIQGNTPRAKKLMVEVRQAACAPNSNFHRVYEKGVVYILD